MKILDEAEINQLVDDRLEHLGLDPIQLPGGATLSSPPNGVGVAEHATDRVLNAMLNEEFEEIEMAPDPIKLAMFIADLPAPLRKHGSWFVRSFDDLELVGLTSTRTSKVGADRYLFDWKVFEVPEWPERKVGEPVVLVFADPPKAIQRTAVVETTQGVLGRTFKCTVKVANEKSLRRLLITPRGEES